MLQSDHVLGIWRQTFRWVLCVSTNRKAKNCKRSVFVEHNDSMINIHVNQIPSSVVPYPWNKKVLYVSLLSLYQSISISPSNCLTCFILLSLHGSRYIDQWTLLHRFSIKRHRWGSPLVQYLCCIRCGILIVLVLCTPILLAYSKPSVNQYLTRSSWSWVDRNQKSIIV